MYKVEYIKYSGVIGSYKAYSLLEAIEISKRCYIFAKKVTIKQLF